MTKKRRPQFPLAQFIAIIVLTISVFLVIDFARRTAATYKIKSEAVRLHQEVAEVRSRHEGLESRLEYVKSDAYVEEIARTQLNWAKEGETVVVVMATPRPAPASPAPAEDSPSDSSVAHAPWEAWWLLFFDALPPQ